MIHTTTTPSGFAIEFEDGVAGEDGTVRKRRYTVDGQALPSVTTILGILDKPGLKYAAETLTMKGAIELARDGDLPQVAEAALAQLKERGLRFWQVWDAKAQRGTLTHEELVALITGQQLLDLDMVPLEQRGFVRGAADWFADHRPIVVDQEVMVASLEHRYAGRHDFFGEIAGIEGRGLIDFKTTEKLPRYKDGTPKAPYDEHLLQLGLYELARRESGYEPSAWQAVVRIDASGAHDTTVSWVDPEVGLAVVGAYHALRSISASKPKRARAA